MSPGLRTRASTVLALERRWSEEPSRGVAVGTGEAVVVVAARGRLLAEALASATQLGNTTGRLGTILPGSPQSVVFAVDGFVGVRGGARGVLAGRSGSLGGAVWGLRASGSVSDGARGG